MAPERPPKAPAGLGLSGRRLWKAVLSDYELNPAELVLLEHACRTADTLARLDTALAEADLSVQGSKGQPVANALLKEAREERQLLGRLLDQLGLPDDGGSVWDGLTASSRARKAALQRWRRA